MGIQINNMKSEEISEMFKSKPVGFTVFSNRGQKIEKTSSMEYEYTSKSGKVEETTSPEYKIVGSNTKWFI